MIEMSCDKCRWFNKKGFASGFGDCVFYRFVCSSGHKVVCEHYEEYEERPHGEWIREGQRYHYLFRCTNCNEDCGREYDFCPNCGADMREGEKG